MPNETKAIDINKVFFVHATSYLPENGVMIPACARDIGLVSIRHTLHWHAQSIFASHLTHDASKLGIIIIEPATEILPESYGGYVEDIITVGPHTLSANVVIFVPNEILESAKEKLPMLEKRIYAYECKKDLEGRINKLRLEKGMSFSIEQLQQVDISNPKVTVTSEARVFTTCSKDLLIPFYKSCAQNVESLLTTEMTKKLQCLFGNMQMALQASMQLHKNKKMQLCVKDNSDFYTLFMEVQATMGRGNELLQNDNTFNMIKDANAKIFVALAEQASIPYTTFEHDRTIFRIYEKLHDLFKIVLINTSVSLVRYFEEIDVEAILSAISATELYIKALIGITLHSNPAATSYLNKRLNFLAARCPGLYRTMNAMKTFKTRVGSMHLFMKMEKEFMAESMREFISAQHSSAASAAAGTDSATATRQPVLHVRSLSAAAAATTATTATTPSETEGPTTLLTMLDYLAAKQQNFPEITEGLLVKRFATIKNLVGLLSRTNPSSDALKKIYNELREVITAPSHKDHDFIKGNYAEIQGILEGSLASKQAQGESTVRPRLEK